LKTRLFIFLIIFYLTSVNINAEQFSDKFDFSLNIFTFKFQYNFQDNTRNNAQGNVNENLDNFEFRYGLCDLVLEHKKSHIGIKYEFINGAMFFYQNASYNTEKVYLFNPTIFWNVLFNDKYILGPFASVNLLSFENLLTFGADSARPITFSLDDYIFDCGLMFVYKTNERFIFPFHLGIEVGYRMARAKMYGANQYERNNFLFVNFVIKGDSLLK